MSASGRGQALTFSDSLQLVSNRMPTAAHGSLEVEMNPMHFGNVTERVESKTIQCSK